MTIGTSDARAACTSPSGIAGTITWNGTNSVIWCDGAAWHALVDSGGISALTGDVTASGSGSVAATIAANAVTSAKILDGTIANADIANGTIANAKLANMAANTVKGNNTGSAAEPVDLTMTQLRAIIGSGTPGSGNYLRGDGTWTAPPSGADNLGNHTATQNLNMASSYAILNPAYVDFPDSEADKLYLYGNTYGIGIENSTLTYWSGGNHRWRIGGTSRATGTESMLLNSTGLTVTGSAGIGTAPTGYRLTAAGDIYANGGWLRSSGNTGWYNETYAGGWYMQDANWIRNYGSKSVLLNATLRADGQIQMYNSSPTIYLMDSDQRSVGLHNNSNHFYILRGDGVGSTGFTAYNGYWPLDVNLEDNSATFGGNVYAFNYFHNSDARLKKDIETIPNSLDLVSRLRGVSYRWKHDDARALGVIAQEVEQVLPSAVKTNAKGDKAVDYDQLIGPLIEAVKELKAANDNFRRTVENQEQEINALKRTASEAR